MVQMYRNMTRRSKIISSFVLVGLIIGIIFIGHFVWREYIVTDDDDEIISQTLENVFSPTAQMMCGFTTDIFIKYYGYEVEVHYVTTEDGYVLTVYRCWSKKYATRKRKPVVLQHGILSTSDVFVMNPGNQSLAFMMADAGFDVWLPNSRGTTYSRKHARLNPDDPFSGYWNFSWTEMGIYDHPAVIDYVLMRTESKTMNFIGHSQGTTSLLVLLSMKPEYNEKISIASLMAPIAYLKHTQPLQKKYFSAFLLLWPAKNTEFHPRSSHQERLNKILCPEEHTTGICGFELSDGQKNRSMELVYLCRSSAISINQAIHYGQLTAFGYFGEFIQNITYPVSNKTMVTPDDFPLSKIRAKISLHYSLGDPATSPEDIAEIRSRVKSIVYVQGLDDYTFSHTDFTLGKTANELIYADILNTWSLY